MSSPNPEPPSSISQSVQNNLKTRVKDLVNFPYFKSVHFILKVILIIFQIAGAIAVGVKYDNWGSTRYYHFVAVTGIIIILILILLHFFHVTKRIQRIPWQFIELFFAGLWSILILIASAIVTDYAKQYAFMESYAAAAFFGFASCIVYIIDGILRLISLIRGRKAQTMQPTS